jgi:hypothetical protein
MTFTAVAGVAGEQDLVSGLDAGRVAADRGHDARAAVRLGGGRDDQTHVRLRLLVRGLDDDEVIERLQRQVDPARVRLLHTLNATSARPR